MNKKIWIPLVFALIAGVFAARLALVLLGTRQATATGPTVEVVVAAREVPAGFELVEEDLTIGKLATEEMPEGMFEDAGELIGRVTTVALAPGQPVGTTLLADSGSAAGLAALVPPGMRAITVEVDEVRGVAGYIVPGCIVDVVTTIERGEGPPKSRTIVEAVEVQVVGQAFAAEKARRDEELGEEPEPVKSVTLLVTPQQAEQIELASTVSRPRLVLRNDKDADVVRSVGYTLTELTGGVASDWGEMLSNWSGTSPFDDEGVEVETEQVSLSPRGGRDRRVEVIRGGRSEQIRVESNEPEPSPTLPGSGDEPVLTGTETEAVQE